MFGIKKLVIGLVVGALLGLWAGTNLVNDRPLFANPFEDRTIADKAKGVAEDVWDDARKAMRESIE